MRRENLIRIGAAGILFIGFIAIFENYSIVSFMIPDFLRLLDILG